VFISLNTFLDILKDSIPSPTINDLKPYFSYADEWSIDKVIGGIEPGNRNSDDEVTYSSLLQNIRPFSNIDRHLPNKLCGSLEHIRFSFKLGFPLNPLNLFNSLKANGRIALIY